MEKGRPAGRRLLPAGSGRPDPVQNSPANWLGSLYYRGEGGEQDYAKAFQLLKWAYDQDTSSNWGAYYLGACCAHGWGTSRTMFRPGIFGDGDWNSTSAFYLLGYLYARGLGGAGGHCKGRGISRRAGDHAEAKEELRHYKKTLFGKWVRR